MNIDQYISELLFQYDCVIIPNFGGFIANYSSTRIHPTKHTFIPPSKNISFNKNLTNNDGLLANHMARKGKITYEEANKVISSCVESWNAILQNGNKIEIQNIGTFSWDSEQNIQFNPDRNINYLTNSFGLTVFQSPPVKRESIEKRIEKKFRDRAPVPSGIKKVTIKKYWPAIVALPFLFLAFWIPLKTNILDDVSINYAVLNPFAVPDAEYFPRVEEKIATTKLLTEPTETSTSSKEIINESEIENWLATASLSKNPGKTDKKPATGTAVKKKYHVIGGCFRNINNARRLLKKLKKKGFDAQIVGQNRIGLYRVSYGGYATRKNALRELRKVRVKYIRSAWLFVQ